MLKKPNLTTEEKTRLKNEILNAIDEGKKLPSRDSLDIDTAATKKIQPDIKIDQPVKSTKAAEDKAIPDKPAIGIDTISTVAEPAMEKNKTVIETKVVPKIVEPIAEKNKFVVEKNKTISETKAAPKIEKTKAEKKESKKHRHKQQKQVEVFPHTKQKAFEVTPEIKIKIKGHQEKHRPNKGLGMLRFIILLLVLIIALLAANLLMLTV